MAYVNFQRSYIRFKIVYYGPGLCGKTTNLEHLHKLAGGQVEMVSLETEGDRTIFFDYMPLNLGKLGGIETVFKLYTVPGQVRYNRTRQMVLRDVDGVIFVADSQREAMPDNVESLRNLEENLAKEGTDLAQLPLVFQYNKRDLPDVLDIEEMERSLNPEGRPHFSASAILGDNVKETLSAISRLVYREAATRYGLTSSLDSEPPEEEPPEAEPPEAEPPEEEPEAAPEGGEVHAIPAESPREEVAPDAQTVAPKPAKKAEPSGDAQTVAPKRAKKAEPSGDVVSAKPEASAAMSAIADLERRVMGQLSEIREVVQQMVMTQVEKESVDEIREILETSARSENGTMQRMQQSLNTVHGAIVGISDQIRNLKADIQRDIKSQVDRYLSDYLKEIEAGIAPMPTAASVPPPRPSVRPEPLSGRRTNPPPGERDSRDLSETNEK